MSGPGVFGANVVELHPNGTPKLAAEGPLWVVYDDDVWRCDAYYVHPVRDYFPAWIVASRGTGDPAAFVWGIDVFATEAEALRSLMGRIDAKRSYLELRAAETEKRLRAVVS